jgi:hypothetical protein
MTKKTSTRRKPTDKPVDAQVIHEDEQHCRWIAGLPMVAPERGAGRVLVELMLS